MANRGSLLAADRDDNNSGRRSRACTAGCANMWQLIGRQTLELTADSVCLRTRRWAAGARCGQWHLLSRQPCACARHLVESAVLSIRHFGSQSSSVRPSTRWWCGEACAPQPPSRGSNICGRRSSPLVTLMYPRPSRSRPPARTFAPGGLPQLSVWLLLPPLSLASHASGGPAQAQRGAAVATELGLSLHAALRGGGRRRRLEGGATMPPSTPFLAAATSCRVASKRSAKSIDRPALTSATSIDDEEEEHALW